LLSETVEITAEDTAATLHDKLSHVAAQLGPRALAALQRGALTATPQSGDGVIYAEKISSAEARIDWSRAAADLDRHIRGLSPFPGAWSEINDERVKILFSRIAAGNGAPGEVLRADEKLIVACAAGAVELVTLQRAGKKPQSAEEFLRGFGLEKGAQL